MAQAKKIAVFCALPPNRNTGMATVDLAADSLIRRLAPGAEVTLYAYGKLNEWSYQPGELPYHYLDVEAHAEQYLASDLFLFWGDFTHARSYWKRDRGALEEEARHLTGEALAAWERTRFESMSALVFLSTLPESRLKDVIVFGGTVITNDAADELDGDYLQAFARLFSGASAAYMRDALSAAKISPLRGGEASLGCDCALLLSPEDVARLSGFTQASERRGVGVFFGRSSSKLRQMVFSRLVGRALGEPCSWIPWFSWDDRRRRARWPWAALGYTIRARDAEAGALLSALSGYRYIVTDTYHLCVNAWRMGIPALCIGEGSSATRHSLSDKKKEVLYEMYGARKFYLFSETLATWKGLFSQARHAAATLKNEALAQRVRQNIADHQAMAKRRLSDALKRLLERA